MAWSWQLRALTRWFVQRQCVLIAYVAVVLCDPPCPQVLEENKAAVGIREWGVTQTSLEEVFVKVVERAESANDSETALQISQV